MKKNYNHLQHRFFNVNNIIFSIFFLLLLVFSFLISSFSATIQVEVNSDISAKFRFYWSGQKGRYTKTDSSAIRIRKGSGIYSQTIGNLHSLTNLRIDPLNKKGTIKIKKIKITQPGFEPIVFASKEQFQKFIPVDQSNQITFGPHALNIKFFATKPILHGKIGAVFRTALFINHLKNVVFFALGICIIFYLFFLTVRLVKEKAESIFDLPKKRTGKHRNLFSITFIIIVLVRLVFYVTYPLNISGDGATYFEMITRWESHLALAGGYPFVFGMFKYFFDTLTIFSPESLAFQIFLLAIQHMFDIGMLVLIYLVLENIFGASVACASVLLYAVNPFVLGNISTTRPEWFQSDLCLISLALSYLGYSTQNLIRKSIFYISSSLFFALGFFVKYNLLPLASVFLLFIWFDKADMKAKLSILASIAVVSFSFYIIYVGLFHKPSTGTRTLTHDRSWILMYKAVSFSSKPGLDIDNGIYTKRYKLLAWFIWRHRESVQHGAVTLYRNINSIPAKVRKFYRDRYGYLLTAGDKKLNRLYHENPEAKTFYISQLIISYFIGLKESDELGVKVFLETVKAEPLNYIKNVLKGFYNSFFIIKENNFPFNRQLGWNDLTRPRGFSKNKHVRRTFPMGFSLVMLDKSRGIGYKKPILWLPGVNLFSLLSRLFYFLPPIAWFLSMIVCVGCFINRWKTGVWLQINLVPLVLAAFLMVFIFFSNITHPFGVRQAKELIFILPYSSIFTGIFFTQIYKISRNTIFGEFKTTKN